MLPIPAIDLKNGQCVRLKQGRMEEATVFSANPVEIARLWVEQGATRLHLVDLDGAFAGTPRNADTVAAIVKTFPGIVIQLGGGIRDEASANDYWDLGVSHCIIGSKAVSDPQSVMTLAAKYPGKLILGIDARNGYIASEGWAKLSSIRASELLAQFRGEHFAAIIYTDIARDGMMDGVNIEQTRALAAASDIPVIASGGVCSRQDILALCAAKPPIYGAIIGRALYEGAFTLKEAYEIAASSR